MPILPVRSTLGGDIATKVHVGDAHANTTPRHRRTAMGAILLLIRLSRTGRHRVRKKRKYHKQNQTDTHPHTQWPMTWTYKKQMEPIPSYLLQFQRTSIAWIIRAVLPFLISWCEVWSKAMVFEPLGHWELFTWYGMMSTARNAPKLMDTPIFLHVFCRASLIVFFSITSILRYSAYIITYLSYVKSKFRCKWNPTKQCMTQRLEFAISPPSPWLLRFVQLAWGWWMGASGSADQLEPSRWWHLHIT